MTMKENNTSPEKTTKPALWKIITMFALLFLAVELIGAGVGLGVNLLMRALNAGENLRVFLGNTLTRGGMIAAALILTASMLTNVLNNIAFRYNLQSTYYKDIITGILLIGAMYFYRKRS